ncbi:hypothetical protein GCM10009663_27390 [Kitasatospora arboriphila]|uniref:HTH cro/C1-type domain-containing protein n=2 Tax=Kitasatospora arboriphila TaxID=258052 RepID=A0ABN1THH9_9ACTN
MSRAQLADAAGVDRSTLSRLERGLYPHRLSTQTIEALTRVLACGSQLFEAAGLPTRTAQDLTRDPALSRAFADGPAARRALRRLHLTDLAESAVAPALHSDGMAVDAQRLWASARKSRGQPPAPAPRTGPGRESGTASGSRFQIAHAAAHVLLGTACGWPYGTDPEWEATELAGLLLAPPRLLTSAVRAAFNSDVDPWDSDTGGLVASVAERLLIPGWLAAYRLGDFPDIHLHLLSDDEEPA